MGDTNAVLDSLIQFINNNPPFVLAMFVLSVAANIIQVGTYLRDRRKLRQEGAERQRLTRLVDTYEDVLRIAKETVEDKDTLAELKEEIQESASTATELSSKITLLEQTAQRKLVAQSIDYNLGVLGRAYSEIERLRKQYENLGELPDLAPESKEAIESEVELAFRRPYELPRDFVFKSALLVLFLLLLPWPVDTLLLPFFIGYFVLAFFDAVWLYPNRRVKEIVIKFHSTLILLAEFGVWYSFFQTIASLLQPLLNSVALVQMSSRNFIFAGSDFWPILPQILSVLPIPLAVLTAIADWRDLREVVRERSLEKIEASLEVES